MDEEKERQNRFKGVKGSYTDRFVGITSKEIEERGDRHKKVIDEFSKHNFNRILDVGCGDGNFSILLKEVCKAKEVYGIEISVKGVESARNNRVRAFQLDIAEEDFPFGDNYFDAVYAGGIIEHLFNVDHFLDETFRVLKPNGIFTLDTPNLASIYNRIALLLGYLPFDMQVSLRYPVGHLYENIYKSKEGSYVRGSDHIRLFTLKSLVMLLEKHKFSILSIYGSSDLISINSPLISSLIKFIDALLVKIPSLSRVTMIVCGKKKK